MQVKSITTNKNTAFGAKLKIIDNKGILRGLNKQNFPAKKYFSEEELRQIENLFEERTKRTVGELHLNVDSTVATTERNCSEIVENSEIFYFQSKLKYPDMINVDITHKMPVSVEDFADRLIKMLKIFKMRLSKEQKILRLSNKARALTMERENETYCKTAELFDRPKGYRKFLSIKPKQNG